MRRLFLPKLGRAQVMSSVLHLHADDILFARSDFSGNTFDCQVSYRELTEQWSETIEEPFSLPWVNFLMAPATSIDSTPTLVFGSTHDCIIDSVFVCNTSDQEIFADLYTLTERNLVATSNYIARKVTMPKYATEELIKSAVINMPAGDLLYINSDFSGNTFDCLVSYREIIEGEPQ